LINKTSQKLALKALSSSDFFDKNMTKNTLMDTEKVVEKWLADFDAKTADLKVEKGCEFVGIMLIYKLLKSDEEVSDNVSNLEILRFFRDLMSKVFDDVQSNASCMHVSRDVYEFYQKISVL